MAVAQLHDDGALVTVLMHESGETIEGRTAIPDTSDIQAFGSAITYLRRYAIQSLLGIAAGADGLMIEAHPNPDHALSDGAQSLTFDQFADLMPRIAAVAEAVGRSLPTASNLATMPA